MINLEWNCRVFYTLREENQCVNFLTKQGANTDDFLLIFHQPSQELRLLLIVDAMGVSFTRL